MKELDYSASSDGLGGDVSGALAKVAQNPISEALRTGAAWIDKADEVAGMAIKLSLSTVGMARNIMRGGVVSGGDDVEGIKGAASAITMVQRGGKKTYSAASAPTFERYDSSKDWFFRCGNYFMPLSIRFTLHAQKNLQESQLVDGPTIIERVSKAPKTIDVTVRLERKETESPTALHVVSDENLYNPVSDISAMIHDLYDNRDVFQIDNPILNREHGVTHVVMREYSITPSEGSTLMTLQMSLTQIDMDANIIANDGDNINADGLFPGVSPLIA